MAHLQVSCTQCGGQIEVGEGELFLNCPHCASAIYVDKRKVVFHYVLATTISPENARASLKRWMAGNETVKGLGEKSKIVEEEFFHFPVWYFRTKKDGHESIHTRLAASTPIVDLQRLSVPGGDLKFYDPQQHQARTMKEPELLYSAALEWLGKEGIAPEQVVESALVHVPVYHFRYEYDGQTYSSIVEASSGNVYSSIYPAKAEAPFYAVAAVAFAIFLIEGLIIVRLDLKLLAYIITAVPLILVSTLVSERV